MTTTVQQPTRRLRLIFFLCGVLCTALAVSAVPIRVEAHQLSNSRGAIVPHHHVYRRAGYGNGLQVGHVAPTAHGNNMIIWSPAPSNGYDLPAPHLQIAPPNRNAPNLNKRTLPSPNRFPIPSPSRERQ
ncbi:MAG: hypothetical protein R3212_04695 [Xanthomonadales bacterium]|nr:hypothetical protein [Xanthomonadales bacterium]